ncbi:MAG: acyltransferase [Bosea sp.]|nr:acyltransferase [Bosea sp. (in: a-proteobacteria)]
MRALVKTVLGRLRLATTNARRRYWTKRVSRTAASCGPDLRANSRTIVTPKTHIGRSANFNGMVITGGGTVRIGSWFHSGRDCLVISSFHNYDGGSRIPYGPKGEDIDKDVTIGDFVWLGDRCIVLGGVTIGEGAIIQAGSVVVSDVPPLAIAGGHPARVFRTRDAAHFEQLKSEGKFH